MAVFIDFLNNNSNETIPKYANPFLVDTLILNYNQNSIIFHFVGLHYTYSKGNKYKIHLEGLYDEAREIGELTQQSYSNIPTGEYTFKIWASNNDGVWSAPKKVKISISSPYWATWEFIVSSSIVKFKDTKQRVQVLTLFLLVAEECRLLNNYNTVIEIVATLHSSPIARLNITWKVC